jgi:hypothetical protein
LLLFLFLENENVGKDSGDQAGLSKSCPEISLKLRVLNSNVDLHKLKYGN